MKENQSQLAARLREARVSDARYPTAADAARAMGIEVPTYLGHENGSRGYSANASRYADFYRVNLEWLLTGRGTMRPSPGTRPDEVPRATKEKPKIDVSAETIQPAPAVYSGQPWPRDLRVLGMAECGPDGWSLWNGEVIELTSRPPNLAGAANAYAVYVVGSSMEPRYFAGELAYIHPGKPPQIGDFVLVQVRPAPGEPAPMAVIKRLVKRSPTKITLEQYQPPKTTEIKLADVISIHLVVGSGKP